MKEKKPKSKFADDLKNLMLECYKKGEEYDTEKAAALLLDDFRNGRLGRITLEQDLGGLEKA